MRREADEIRSLGEEHTEAKTLGRRVYDAVELSLRVLADNLEIALREVA